MRLRAVVAVLVAGLAVRSALAQQPGPVTLKVGDAAPPLAVGKWVKGEPVAKIERGKVHVVEFWATWCGPCLETIPHLSELAKKYRDVIVIGQNVFEQDDSLVRPFVDRMGDQMAYRVATDDKTKSPEGAMSDTWMTAAGQNVIPLAFIVDKDAKVAWIGHPMEMEPVLQKVIQGTYDAKAAAAEAAKVASINQRVIDALKKKDTDAVLAATKELVALKPDLADTLTLFEFNVLVRAGRADDARTRAETILKAGRDAQALNMVAWGIATQSAPAAADLAIARRAIDRANELTDQKQADLFDTSARVYAVQKDWAKAAETQQKALTLAEGEAKPELQKTLDAYKAQQLPAAE